MDEREALVVVGNGMVGHELLAICTRSELTRRFRIVTFCEEPRLAYDRVNLSSFFDGKPPEALALAAPDAYANAGIEVHVGDRAVAIDREARVVRSARGVSIGYDKLVLATGSYPFVPPVPGRDARGCFVYRTIEDLEAIRDFGRTSRVGVVIGGGLLGLEAANALARMGLEAHIVEFAPRLMAVQLDELGGAALRRRIEALGLHVHTGKNTSAIVVADGMVTGLRFADGAELAADMVVFSAGIRPRDELARAAGLTVGERGGVVIDERCRTSDPDVLAIGECALYRGRVFGLLSPGYKMARVVAETLAGNDATLGELDVSTKLKVLGVEVAAFGDALGAGPDARATSFQDGPSDTYKKLVLSKDGRRLLGGMLVGDASSYAELHQLFQSGAALPPHPEDLLVPQRGGAPRVVGVAGLPPTATICSCHNVTKEAICSAIEGGGLTAVPAIKACTKAGTGCGSCVPLITDLLGKQLEKAGKKPLQHLCEHFPRSRQELHHLVRLHAIKTFDALVARHGIGKGCEIRKPAVASILASVWNEHVLDDRHAPLQDTNDRFLANIQRDGTYSVVPRVPGGEITPEKLIVLGQVAQKYGLYAKITGGQRIDLFGARVEQLPDIWGELCAAGFESGHAYGKALRTVKSCVGSTWCRYGVQDSVSFAIRLENRYKGLRSPHKLKAAASGCARECAEAQSKDFGVIATDRGYNLYLCGNGGMKPRHAELFATDLDEETVVKYLDRFLMFYIRTADRLQRTATWFDKLEGGIEYLRGVLIDDSLGICAELEAEMARVVGSYRCEWKATLDDPEKLERFRPFVNDGGSDPSIVNVRLREQHRPASWEEKAAMVGAMVDR